MKVCVSLPALMARLNRRLAKDGEKLVKTRGGAQALLDCGAYYIVNTSRNLMAYHDVDPEELARELGVLKPWEKVAS